MAITFVVDGPLSHVQARASTQKKGAVANRPGRPIWRSMCLDRHCARVVGRDTLPPRSTTPVAGASSSAVITTLATGDSLMQPVRRPLYCVNCS